MNPNDTDTKLTDHLFDELSKAESSEYETRLANDPELLAEKAELAEVLDLLVADMPEDLPVQLDENRRATILKAAAVAPTKKPWWPVLLPMAAAAAVVAVGTFIKSTGTPRMEMAKYAEAAQATESAADSMAPMKEELMEEDAGEIDLKAADEEGFAAKLDLDQASATIEAADSAIEAPPQAVAPQKVRLVAELPKDVALPPPTPAAPTPPAAPVIRQAERVAQVPKATNTAQEVQLTASADDLADQVGNDVVAIAAEEKEVVQPMRRGARKLAKNALPSAMKPKSAPRTRTLEPVQAEAPGQLEAGRIAANNQRDRADDMKKGAGSSIESFGSTNRAKMKAARQSGAAPALGLQADVAAAAAPRAAIIQLIPTPQQIATLKKQMNLQSLLPVVQKIKIEGQSFILAAIPASSPLPKRNDPRIVWSQQDPNKVADLILITPATAKVLGLLPAE